MASSMEFSVRHARDTSFESDGLRTFFEYRDLGIGESTGGKFHAHVIRAREGHGERVGWHQHDLEFQMVYILKGWAIFEYEGKGEVRLEAGDCVHQPPGIRHREVDHSDDLELIEITSPADFATAEAESPA